MPTGLFKEEIIMKSINSSQLENINGGAICSTIAGITIGAAITGNAGVALVFGLAWIAACSPAHYC